MITSLASIHFYKLQPVRLSLFAEYVNHSVMFSPHNKSANNTFIHNFSAKRIFDVIFCTYKYRLHEHSFFMCEYVEQVIIDCQLALRAILFMQTARSITFFIINTPKEKCLFVGRCLFIQIRTTKAYAHVQFPFALFIIL